MTIKHPENCTLVPWEHIEMADRARKDFGDLESLAGSILSKGLLHPPTVSRQPENSRYPFILIGGERRMQAMRLLKLEEYPVNVREEMPEHELRELELIENFHRKEMKWQEQCLLISKTHRLKVLASSEDSVSWGTRETGALLGVSNAHVSHATTVADYILSGDDEVIGAASLFAAYEVLLRRRENQAAALANVDMTDNSVRAATRAGFLIPADEHDIDAIFDLSQIDTSRAILAQPAERKELNFDFSSLCQHGDCLEVMSRMPDECIDHVVTDPPYGIDMTQLESIKNLETVIDTHDADQNISMFEPFLAQAYRLLKPSGYCVFWFDLTHFEKHLAIATKLGFIPCRWPIIWQKLHPCLNNSPRVNFTKNMEFAMVLRKSSSAFLVEPQVTSFIPADGQADRKLYDNPFSKPQAVWTFILRAISRPGQVILDPYMGQASSLRAVINLNMIPMGIEIDPDHYNKGVLNLTRLQNEINGKR
jgi:DNA modification methylase